MKKQYKGEVTRIVDGEFCVMYVEELNQAFDVFYGELDESEKELRIGEYLFFTVKYEGAHNLGFYSAWI